ncbi:CaiF/GrlA family transcriptional regulator [Trabulsiella odontotermitis]|uniref:CaiF/GrlA family transcriptional regulator n=1 Tax=Trabulsiella odontotermitis TaxID=379893 RepID=UPI0009BFF03D
MNSKAVYYPRKPQPYRIPPELEKEFCENLPLYMIIAYWALLKGTPVTVRDVRLAFEISLRRASDLLEYLTEQGSKVVQAECYMIPSIRGGKCMCRAWNVMSVNGELARLHNVSPAREQNSPTSSKDGSLNEEFQDLRRWIVQRRTGETIS